METHTTTVHIIARMVTGSVPYNFQARGTSIGMAVQEVAYVAMSHLCHELGGLDTPPYSYFPLRGLTAKVNEFAEITLGEDPSVRQLASLVRAMDRAHRCTLHELWETRSRLGHTQQYLCLMVQTNQACRDVLYGSNHTSPHNAAPPTFSFPPCKAWHPMLA